MASPLKISVATASSILLVVVAYVWFISFGLWTNWDQTTDYYDQLANAFAHGSLALEKPVDPALLALANPYSPAERKGLDYPLDFSLYQGKYYMYFGPTPAVLLIIPKLLGAGRIGDEHLVFSFTCGMFIVFSLIIIELWKGFFHDIPGWVIPITLIFAGLVSPQAWMLTEARVYEAAVTSSGFFFLAGLYLNITALTRKTHITSRLVLGGTLWVLTLGSRITQILPVGSMVLILMIFFVRKNLVTRSVNMILGPILALGIPLIIGGSILAWYNWARFDSIFETGFYYQLTTRDLQRYSNKLFLPAYILPNSYEYFVAPPKVINEFPFLQPIRGRGYLHFPQIKLPKIYHTRALTGIFYSTPFVIFASISVISLGLNRFFQRQGLNSYNELHVLNWIIVALCGSFILGFFTVVSFFWVVTRYFIEFSPSFILLSIIGFWLGYRILSPHVFLQRIYLTVGIILMTASVVIGNLLVFAIRAPIYQAWNPVLWNQLTRLF